MTERLLTAREVAELVGLSTESVLRRWRAGEIPGSDASETGLRPSEWRALEWRDVDKAAGGLRVERVPTRTA